MLSMVGLSKTRLEASMVELVMDCLEIFVTCSSFFYKPSTSYLYPVIS